METIKDEKRQQGYIYQIIAICDDFDEKFTYYGSTFNELRKRLWKHRADYKQWKLGQKGCSNSYKLFEKYGVNNCKILLIETLKDVNKQELHAKEYSYIMSNPCINKHGKLGIIAENKQQYDKEYSKQYYQANKEAIAEKDKQYRQANKEAISEYQKQYRQANKEAINKKITCACGGKYTTKHKARHEKTTKHQKFTSK